MFYGNLVFLAHNGALDANRQVYRVQRSTILIGTHIHSPNMACITCGPLHSLSAPPQLLFCTAPCHLFKCSLIVWPQGSPKTHTVKTCTSSLLPVSGGLSLLLLSFYLSFCFEELSYTNDYTV